MQNQLQVRDNLSIFQNIKLKSQQRYMNNLSNEPDIKQFNSIPISKTQSKPRIKTENWQKSEIKKIFTLYTQYGSEWKLIETQFADKSSNSIKNRFYTVVRTFLKNLFKYHAQIKYKLPHQIPSKTILKFYEGRQEFYRFKGFGKKILKIINYDVESKQLENIVQRYLCEIKVIYDLIFDQKLAKTSKNRSRCSGTKQGNKNSNTSNNYGKQKGNLVQRTDSANLIGENNLFDIRETVQDRNQMQKISFPTEIIFIPTISTTTSLCSLYHVGYQYMAFF